MTELADLASFDGLRRAVVTRAACVPIEAAVGKEEVAVSAVPPLATFY